MIVNRKEMLVTPTGFVFVRKLGSGLDRRRYGARNRHLFWYEPVEAEGDVMVFDEMDLVKREIVHSLISYNARYERDLKDLDVVNSLYKSSWCVMHLRSGKFHTMTAVFTFEEFQSADISNLKPRPL